MASDTMTLAEIIASIMSLCREQRTGTLFVKNGHRLVGQIGIESGDIVFLFSLGKRGMAAIPLLLSATEGGQATFLPGQVPIKIPLPPTAEILESLTAPPATKNSPHKGNGRAGEPLSAATRTVLENTLREFIGPIAGALCSDLFRSATSIDIVVATLASELPTREMATRFRELVRQRLG